VHGDNVERLLADNLAAVRSVRVAVLALDDEFDPNAPFDPAVAQAQLAAYAAPWRYDVREAWIEPRPAAGSTRLHELAEAVAPTATVADGGPTPADRLRETADDEELLPRKGFDEDADQ
jgi:hypothetical protein